MLACCQLVSLLTISSPPAPKWNLKAAHSVKEFLYHGIPSPTLLTIKIQEGSVLRQLSNTMDGFSNSGTGDPVLVSTWEVLGKALIGVTVRLNYHCMTTTRSHLVPWVQCRSPQDYRGRSWGVLIDPSRWRRGEGGGPVGQTREGIYLDLLGKNKM